MWINSFKRVNLHPDHRLSFKYWTVKIASFLTAGSIFKNFNEQPTSLEKCALLPSFWWGMKPTERQQAVDIVTKYGENSYDMACTDELHDQLKISYANISDLRVSVIIALEHPETVDYDQEEPDWDEVKRAKNERSGIHEGNSDNVNINSGLNSFQRIPKTKDGVPLLLGQYLFDHMVEFRNNICSVDGRLEPSKYLDLEVSSGQNKLLNLAE